MRRRARFELGAHAEGSRPRAPGDGIGGAHARAYRPRPLLTRTPARAAALLSPHLRLPASLLLFSRLSRRPLCLRAEPRLTRALGAANGRPAWSGRRGRGAGGASLRLRACRPRREAVSALARGGALVLSRGAERRAPAPFAARRPAPGRGARCACASRPTSPPCPGGGGCCACAPRRPPLASSSSRRRRRRRRRRRFWPRGARGSASAAAAPCDPGAPGPGGGGGGGRQSGGGGGSTAAAGGVCARPPLPQPRYSPLPPCALRSAPPPCRRRRPKSVRRSSTPTTMGPTRPQVRPRRGREGNGGVRLAPRRADRHFPRAHGPRPGRRREERGAGRADVQAPAAAGGGHVSALLSPLPARPSSPRARAGPGGGRCGLGGAAGPPPLCRSAPPPPLPERHPRSLIVLRRHDAWPPLAFGAAPPRGAASPRGDGAPPPPRGHAVPDRANRPRLPTCDRGRSALSKGRRRAAGFLPFAAARGRAQLSFLLARRTLRSHTCSPRRDRALSGRAEPCGER